jgi:glutamyl-tRNA reductase
MRIVLVGINHRTASVALREQLAVAGDDLPAALDALKHRYPGIESVLLSTCNRTELYVARPAEQGPTVAELRQFLAEQSGVAVDDLTPASIHREQEPAVRHLFRVAAGLDSMVVGEPQILGQVKRAYEAAVDAESVGSVLHQVFQQAISAGKAVRRETAIGQGNLSVGSVEVDFARQIFADLRDKQVVSVGIGEMTKPMLRHLLGQSPKRLWLVNRTAAQATALAEALELTEAQGGARPWEQLDELLVQADIVLTATGAAEPILTAGSLKPLLRRRRNRPLFIVDLALPRDVEQDVGALNNVFLYNIDDLQAAIHANRGQRDEAVHACEQHIGQAVHTCMAQIQHQDLGQLVRQLRQQLHAIGEQEQQRTDRKLAAHAQSGDPQMLSEIVGEHTHRVINKILHMPLSQLDNRDGEAPLGFYAAALRRLFHLEDATAASSTTQPEPANESAAAGADAEADEAHAEGAGQVNTRGSAPDQTDHASQTSQPRPDAQATPGTEMTKRSR